MAYPNKLEEGLDFSPQFNMQHSPNPALLITALLRGYQTGELLRVSSVSRDECRLLLQDAFKVFRRIGVDCDQDALDLVRDGDCESDFPPSGKETPNTGALDFNLISPLQPDVRLIPAIAQDTRTNEILMSAFADRAALDATLQKGMATFLSRKRGLWTKGETSGDFLKLDELRVSREGDAVLYRVTPQGKGACHTKDGQGETRESCFYRKIANLDEIRSAEDSIGRARLEFI